MEAAPAPARRLGFLRSAKAFWHPHIALMLPLGFCMGVPLIWTFNLHLVLTHLEVKSVVGLFVILLVSHHLSFVWAPVFDQLPLPWLTGRLGRRRSWMLVTHVLCMVAMISLGILGPSAETEMILLLGLIVALTSSSLSAVANAYRIEILEENRYGAGEAVTGLGIGLGSIVLLLFLSTADDANIQAVSYAAAPALLLVGAVIALLGPEPASLGEPDMAAREDRFADAAAGWGGAVAAWFSRVFLSPLTEFFTRPVWLAAVAFLLLFKLGSGGSEFFQDNPADESTSPVGTIVLFLIDSNNFKSGFQIAAPAEFTSFVGTIVAAMLVHARGALPCLLIAASLLLVMNAVLLALDWASAESIWIGLALLVREFGEGFGTVAVVAYAMGLSRPSYTATQFALFSAVMVFAQMAPGPRSWLAGLLGERLDGMFLSVTLASLLSLLLLRVLWKRRQQEETGS